LPTVQTPFASRCFRSARSLQGLLEVEAINPWTVVIPIAGHHQPIHNGNEGGSEERPRHRTKCISYGLRRGREIEEEKRVKSKPIKVDTES